jgi:DNA-binding CsgD family transcriptional regulator
MERATITVRVLDSPQAHNEAARLLDMLHAHRVVVVTPGGTSRRQEVVVRLEGDRTAAPGAPDDLREGEQLVIVCNTFESARMSAVIAEGVLGVVLIAEAERTLLSTIAAVAGGQICFPRPRSATARPILSIREKQVIGLVALGLSNSEIAGRLFVAESTVKSHLTSAFSKLGVRSRHEAVDLLLNPESGLGLGFLSLVPDSDQLAD